MHFSLALLAASALSAVAVPLPAPVPAPQSTANTGLGSLLNGQLTKSRLDVANGLKEMSNALSTLSSSGSAQVKTLAKSATSDVSRAQAGVDAIGKNILAGVDPNTGNNPQGEVAAGIVAANKTVAQISAVSKAPAVSDLESGLASAISGGEGVLGAQNKTLSNVLGKNGEPLPVSSSSSSSSSTTDASSSSSAGGLGGLLSGLGLKEEPEKRQTGASNPLSGLLGSLGGGASSSSTSGAAGGLGGILGGLTGGATSGTTGSSTAGTSTAGTSTAGGLGGLLSGLTGGLGGGATSGATGTSTSGTSTAGGLGALGGLLGGAAGGAGGASSDPLSGLGLKAEEGKAKRMVKIMRGR